MLSGGVQDSRALESEAPMKIASARIWNGRVTIVFKNEVPRDTQSLIKTISVDNWYKIPGFGEWYRFSSQHLDAILESLNKNGWIVLF